MPKRRVRGVRALEGTAIVVACGIALAACGSASEPTARSLVSQALRNARAATWVHDVQSAIEPGHKFNATNDIGAKSGRQVIAIDGSHSTVIVLHDMAYIKGNEKAIVDYFQIPTKHPAAAAGKWISLAPTDGGYAAVSSAVTIASDFGSVTILGPLREGAVVTLGGHKVLPIIGHVKGSSGSTVPATLYVTTSGTVLPVEFHVSKGSFSETTSWSDWGESIVLVTPAPSTPIARIIG